MPQALVAEVQVNTGDVPSNDRAWVDYDSWRSAARLNLQAPQPTDSSNQQVADLQQSSDPVPQVLAAEVQVNTEDVQATDNFSESLWWLRGYQDASDPGPSS